MANGALEDRVTTYGLDAAETEKDPITGGTISAVPTELPSAQTSAPPLSDQGTGSNAPVGPDARQQQGGGAEPIQEIQVQEKKRSDDFSKFMTDQGTPELFVQEQMTKNPQQASEVLSGSVSAVEKQRKVLQSRLDAGDTTVLRQLQSLNAQLGIDNPEAAQREKDRYLHPETGQLAIGAERAYQDGKMGKEEYKQKKWALKNIYRHIKPEEMGLFLIDFGMRAMMAGETMGDLGALGAAGSGAMGALQERRRYATEQGIAAGERAAEDTKWAEEQALKEREVGAKEKTAEARMISAKSGYGPDGRKPFRDEIAVKALMASGYSETEANLIVYANGMAEEEARAVAEESYNRMLDNGRPKSIGVSDWISMTEEEKAAYEKQWKEDFIEAVSVKRKRGGALSDDEAAAQRALAKVSKD